MTADPIRIGILNDLASGPPDPTQIRYWLNLVIDELTACGRLTREIELIDAWGLGLPSGSAEAVVDAYEELCGKGVQMIIGPAIGDNALIATPLADKYCIPTINWAGSEKARGEYMFQLQVGSHQEEPVVIARYLAANNISGVGVIYDDSPIGQGYIDMFRQEAATHTINIDIELAVQPLASDLKPVTDQFLAAQPQACVYLGLGHTVAPAAALLSAAKWKGMRVMTSAGIRGYAPEFASIIDGWTYVDLFTEENRTLQQLLQRHRIPATKSLAAAKGYDLGRLMVHAVINAPEPTPEGIRIGLEKIKWLPAAEGREGTLLGFGRQDRGALHGQYLVLRRWLDGKTVACPC